MNQSRWAPKAEIAKEEPNQNKIKEEVSAASTSRESTDPSAPPTDALAPSSLSAAATTFSPSTTAASEPLVEPPTQPPAPPAPNDEFAQTGGGEDDLFDDAVLTDDESMRVRDDDDLFSDDFVPAPAHETIVDVEVQPVSETVTPSIAGQISTGARDAPTVAPSRGNNGSRGRGVRGRAAANPRNDQRSPAQQSAPQNDRSNVPNAPNAPEDAPTGPKKESVPAVKGDRQATGGIKRPKLTEEELAEKMAQIQIKNASLVAAHARAEADAASFAQRENQAKLVAAQRQKVERRDRQQMMGEREKNRMRKLKAMEGREWDAEKNEDDFHKGGKFDRKGGFAGDDADYTDGREYLYREPRGGGTPRGGRRGGRDVQADSLKAPPKQEDFPALPGGKTSASLTGAITSWADQVENS